MSAPEQAHGAEEASAAGDAAIRDEAIPEEVRTTEQARAVEDVTTPGEARTREEERAAGATAVPHEPPTPLEPAEATAEPSQEQEQGAEQEAVSAVPFDGVAAAHERQPDGFTEQPPQPDAEPAARALEEPEPQDGDAEPAGSRSPRPDGAVGEDSAVSSRPEPVEDTDAAGPDLPLGAVEAPAAEARQEQLAEQDTAHTDTGQPQLSAEPEAPGGATDLVQPAPAVTHQPATEGRMLTQLFAEADLEDVLGRSGNPLDPAELMRRARADRPKVTGEIDGFDVRTAIVRMVGRTAADHAMYALIDNAFSDEQLKEHFHRSLDGGYSVDLGARVNGGPQVVVEAVGLGTPHGVASATDDFGFSHTHTTENRSASVTRQQPALEPRAARIPLPFLQIAGKIAGLINARDTSLSTKTKRDMKTEVAETGVPVARAGHTVTYRVSVRKPGRWPWSGARKREDVVHIPVKLAWPKPAADTVTLPDGTQDAGQRRTEEVLHAEFAGVGPGVLQAVEGALGSTFRVNDPVARELRAWLDQLPGRAPELFGGQMVRKSFPFKGRWGRTQVAVAVAKDIVVRDLPEPDGTVTRTHRISEESTWGQGVTRRWGGGLTLGVGNTVHTAGVLGPVVLGYSLTKSVTDVTDTREHTEAETYKGPIHKRQAEFALVVRVGGHDGVAQRVDGGVATLWTRERDDAMPADESGSTVSTDATTETAAFDEAPADTAVLDEASTETAAFTAAASQDAATPRHFVPEPAGVSRFTVADRLDAAYRLTDETVEEIAGRVLHRLEAEGLLDAARLPDVATEFRAFLREHAREVAHGGDGVRFPLSAWRSGAPDVFVRGVLRPADGRYLGDGTQVTLSGTVTASHAQNTAVTRRKDGGVGVAGAGSIAQTHEAEYLGTGLAYKANQVVTRNVTQRLRAERPLGGGTGIHRFDFPVDFEVRVGGRWSAPGEVARWREADAAAGYVAATIPGRAEVAVPERTVVPLAEPTQAPAEPSAPLWREGGTPRPVQREGHLPAGYRLDSLKPVPGLQSTVAGMLSAPSGTSWRELYRRPLLGSAPAAFDQHQGKNWLERTPDEINERNAALDVLENFTGPAARMAGFERTVGFKDTVTLKSHNRAGLAGNRELLARVDLSARLGDPRIVAVDEEHTFGGTRFGQVEQTSDTQRGWAVKGKLAGGVTTPLTDLRTSVGAELGGSLTYAETQGTSTAHAAEAMSADEWVERGYLVTFDVTYEVRTRKDTAWQDLATMVHRTPADERSTWALVPDAATLWVPAREIHRIGELTEQDIARLFADDAERYRAAAAETDADTEPQPADSTPAAQPAADTTPEEPSTAAVDGPADIPAVRAPANTGRGSGRVELYRLEAGGELVQQIARRLDQWSVENSRTASARVAKFDRINDRLIHDVLGPSLTASGFGTVIEEMLNGGRPVFLAGDTPFGKVEQLVVLRARLGEGHYHATLSRHTSKDGLETTERTTATTQRGLSASWGVYAIANPGVAHRPASLLMAGFGHSHSWTAKNEVTEEHMASAVSSESGAASVEGSASQSGSRSGSGSGSGESVQFLHDLLVTMDVYPYAGPGYYSRHLPDWMPKLGGRSFGGSWTAQFTLPGAARSTVPTDEVLPPREEAGPSAPVHGSPAERQHGAGPELGLPERALVRPFDAPGLRTALDELAFGGRDGRPVLRPRAGFELQARTGAVPLRSKLADAMSPRGHVIEITGDALAQVTVRADVVAREVVRTLREGSLTTTASDTSKAEPSWTSAGEAGPAWYADLREPTIHLGDHTAANRPFVLGDDAYSTWLTYGGPKSVTGETTRKEPEPEGDGDAGPRYLVRLTPRWTVTPAYRAKKLPARWREPITTGPDEPILVVVDREGLHRLGLAEPGDDVAPGAGEVREPQRSRRTWQPGLPTVPEEFEERDEQPHTLTVDAAPEAAVRVADEPLHGVAPLTGYRLRRTDTAATGTVGASSRLELVDAAGEVVPDRTVLPREGGGFVVRGDAGNLFLDSRVRFEHRELELPGVDHVVRLQEPAGIQGPLELLDRDGVPVENGRLARFPDGLTVTLPLAGRYEGAVAEWRFDTQGVLVRQRLPQAGESSGSGISGRGKAPMGEAEAPSAEASSSGARQEQPAEPQASDDATEEVREESGQTESRGGQRARWRPGLPPVPEGLPVVPGFRLLVPSAEAVARYELLGLPTLPEVVDASGRPMPGWTVASRADGGYTASDAAEEVRWQFGADRLPQALDVRLAGTEDFLRFGVGEDGPELSVTGADHYELGEVRDASGELTEVWVSAPGDALGWRFDGNGVPRDVEVPLRGEGLPEHLTGALIRRLRVPVSPSAPHGWIAELTADDPLVVASHGVRTTSDGYLLTDRVTDEVFRFGTDGTLVPARPDREAPWRTWLRRLDEGLLARRAPRVRPQNHVGTVGVEYDENLARIFDETLPKARWSGPRSEPAQVMVPVISHDATAFLRRSGLDPSADPDGLAELRAAAHEALWSAARQALEEAGRDEDAAGFLAQGFTVLPPRPDGLRPVRHGATGLETLFGPGGELVSHQIYLHEAPRELSGQPVQVTHTPDGEYGFAWADSARVGGHLTIDWAGDENGASTDPRRQFVVANQHTGDTFLFGAEGTPTEPIPAAQDASSTAPEPEQPEGAVGDAVQLHERSEVPAAHAVQEPEQPAAPPSHAEVPWYMGQFGMDAHGELNVSAVDRWDEALVRQWANNIAYAVRRDGDSAELETGIREALRTILRSGAVPETLAAGEHSAASEGERALDFWEAALQRGRLATAGGHVVWVRPVLRNVEPLPQEASPIDGYALNWGSLATTHKSAREGGWSGASSLLTAISTGSRVASSVTPAPVLSVEAHRTGQTQTNRTVVFDRKIWMQQSTPFRAGLQLRLFVDGEERRHDLIVPDRLTVRLPKSLTVPGALQHVPHTAPALDAVQQDAGRHRARTILNAIDLTPTAAEFERRLHAAGLPTDAVRALMERTLVQLNERSAINRSRFLLGNELVTDLVSHSTGLGRSFQGHVAIRARIEGLEYLGDTVKVPVREDSAGTLVVHRKEGAKSSAALGGRVVAGPAEFFSFTGEVQRGTSQGLAVSTALHTIVQTSDDHARYRAWLSVSLDVRSPTHRIEPLTRIVPAELGVPSHEAADFERRVLGADAPLLRQPQPGPAGPVQTRPYVRALLAEAAELGVGLPESAYRRPERLDAPLPQPHPREPLALATRRGLGFGTLLGLPGAELVHDQIRTVIGQTHQQLTRRRPKLTGHPPFLELGRPRVDWAGADRELLTAFGRPSLETDLAQLTAGVEHSVRLGGRTYHVSVTARLRERVGGATGDETRPMSLNIRSGQGATVSGERKNGWKLRAFLGARGDTELTRLLRLRLGQAGLTGSIGRGTEHQFSGAAKSTQRADMGGKADEHVYDAVYELSVRTDGHPEQKWWIDRPGEVVARVAVPHLHVPSERIPAHLLDEAGRVRPLASLPPAEQLVDFTSHGSAVVYRSLLAAPEVAHTAATLYQQANGLPDEWQANPANWPAELKKPFAPNELVAHFPSLTTGQGRLMELPDGLDGWHQALRVQLVGAEPRHVQAHTGAAFQLWQNTSGTAHYERTVERTHTLGLAGRLGPSLHFGQGEEDGEASAAPGVERLTTGEERPSAQHHPLTGELRATFGGGFQWGWESGHGTAVGPVGITRGTYGGPKHTYRAHAVFRITLHRWRGSHLTGALTRSASGTTSVERVLEVGHGLEFVVPERRIFDLGLPVPDGVTPVEPQPPTGHFDLALLPGGTHPEVLQADGVLETMKQWLTEQGLLRPDADGFGHRPSLLLSSVEASYSPAALLDQFTLLNTTGVTRWLPIPSAFGATRYLWTKVTAETLEPVSQHDRPELTMMLRGKAITEETTSTSRSTEVEVHGELHGGIGRGTEGGLQVAGGWSGEASTAHERHEENVEVYWGQTRNPSVEFRLRQRFRIEMALTRQLPEVLSAPVRLLHGISLAVSSLMGRRRWAAAAARPQSYLARFPQRPEDGTVDGWVRVVIPEHLVRPGQAPQPAPDHPRHTTPPVWQTEEQPLNDALVDLMSEHGHPWALPAATEINRWAVLPAAPTTTRPRPEAPQTGRPDRTTLPGMLYDHLTNEVQMRLSLERLLRHRYQVKVGAEQVTAGMRLTRVTVLPQSDVEILSRHFHQGRETQEHLHGRTGAWFAGAGPDLGGDVDGHSLRDSAPLRYEGETSGERAAEAEEILERNVASVRPFRYYKADVELVLSGRHGKLLVDVPGGLYFMLPTDLADSPALTEVLVTEPESNTAHVDDDAGQTSGAERTTDRLVETFLTRVNGDAAPDASPPEAPTPAEPPLEPASASGSGTPTHQSDGAETPEASAERFLARIDRDQPAADTGRRTDMQ
ncbi:hypothetical protein [Streptomyces sp. NPDC001492]